MLKDIKYVIEIICLENWKLFFAEFLTEANFFLHSNLGFLWQYKCSYTNFEY